MKFFQITTSILDFLFPIQCLGCKKEKTYCCETCFLEIPRLDKKFPQKSDDWIFAAAKFKEKSLLACLIHFFKYDGIRTINSTFMNLFPNSSPFPFIQTKTILIPVPLHPRRFRKRGFNQSALIAEHLGKRWNYRVLPDLLIRHRFTQAQAELTKEKRLTNVRDAFRLKSSEIFLDETTQYLLVDDVCTTGATLTECAKALETGGAKHIYGVVIARTV